jgi:hypothetical protein
MQEARAPGWLYPRKLHAVCPSRVPVLQNCDAQESLPIYLMVGGSESSTKLRNQCQQTSSYPTLYDHLLPLAVLLSIKVKDYDATVIASNCSTPLQHLECANAITITATHAIADTGATSIFIMKGMPAKNLRWSDHPITITLPDGSKVISTYICDITIPGLPTMLMGHILLGITMASLIGIRIFCKVGCKVIFDDKKCEVIYKDNIFLRCYKDPTTDLWTLPLTPNKILKTTLVKVLISPNSAHMTLSDHVEHAKAPINHAEVPEPPSTCVMLDGRIIKTTPPQPGSCKKHAPSNPVVETSGFSYAQTSKTNNVKFAHQSLCNPPIPSLIKAVNARFIPSLIKAVNARFLKGPRTWMCTQYKSISLLVQPPQSNN